LQSDSHSPGDILARIQRRQHVSVLTSDTRAQSNTLTEETPHSHCASVLVDPVERHIGEVRGALSRIPADGVHAIVEAILHAHARGGHVYVLGNGGSAATASHLACDLSKATATSRRRGLRVTALNDSAALLTAWANDTAYERVFAEPLRTLLDPGDVVIAISASGNSGNVLEAVAVARSLGAVTVALTGFGGGRLLGAVDLALVADSSDYGVVEDCHLVLQHAIIAATRAALHA
jgi:D-sedoheptulose 7-phosphate isomerase